jgi:hypothetical protein
VTAGVFSVVLGAVPSNPLPPSVFASPDRWVQLTVDKEVLLPQQRLASLSPP